MGVDYIPERDHRAAVWMKIFAEQLVANSDAYRTTSDQEDQINSAVTAFRTANAMAWSNSTRTPVSVLAKKEARKAAEQLIRPMAQRVRVDVSISPALKVSLGLKATAKRRRHVGPPESVPVLAMMVQTSGLVEVRLVDSQSNRKARPAGAIGYELYQRIVPAAMTDDTTQPWRFMGTYTTTPITVTPSVQQPGDQVWLTSYGSPPRRSRGVCKCKGSVRGECGDAGGIDAQTRQRRAA